ncbi:hypothetical protein [Streptomyces sp. TLI_171]|uniref:hypothetical protein n=1 Tax=Streptomyces sp. TLI_171 TaxID=1938859 RepID=UPI000C182D74|nr:hypothetical protein [Streptomyces sp. TLI_171]RKE17318.1 hypothetical protein BX266_0574 [Streptomyces sp. TLI_171]
MTVSDHDHRTETDSETARDRTGTTADRGTSADRGSTPGAGSTAGSANGGTNGRWARTDTESAAGDRTGTTADRGTSADRGSAAGAGSTAGPANGGTNGRWARTDTESAAGDRTGTSADRGSAPGTANGGGNGRWARTDTATPAPAAPATPGAPAAPAAGSSRPASYDVQTPAGTPRADLAKAEERRPREEEGVAALLPPDLAAQLTRRLDRAVGTFVDDPAQAVAAADKALDEAVQRLNDALHERHVALRDAWHPDAGQGTSAEDSARTENLRLSLREYRDLLQHLLAV